MPEFHKVIPKKTKKNYSSKVTWYEFDEEKGRYYNLSGGFCFPDSFKILEKVQADDFQDLNWEGTFLNVKDEDIDSGWLSPTGKFYPCYSRNHDLCAFYLIKEEVSDLESKGWVRIYSMDDWTCSKRLTAEQRNWLLNYGYTIDKANDL